MQYLLEHVWCCLSYVEQTMLQYALYRYRYGYGHVLKSDFEILWYGLTGFVGDPRYECLIVTYFLIPGVVEYGPDDFRDVYFFSAGFWNALSVFGDGGGFECTTPCYINRDYGYPV
jgi:hypothetical protein